MAGSERTVTPDILRPPRRASRRRSGLIREASNRAPRSIAGPFPQPNFLHPCEVERGFAVENRRALRPRFCTVTPDILGALLRTRFCTVTPDILTAGFLSKRPYRCAGHTFPRLLMIVRPYRHTGHTYGPCRIQASITLHRTSLALIF